MNLSADRWSSFGAVVSFRNKAMIFVIFLMNSWTLVSELSSLVSSRLFLHTTRCLKLKIKARIVEDWS